MSLILDYPVYSLSPTLSDVQGFAEALQSEMARTDQSEEVGESGQDQHEEEEKGKKEDEQEKSDSV